MGVGTRPSKEKPNGDDGEGGREGSVRRLKNLLQLYK